MWACIRCFVTAAASCDEVQLATCSVRIFLLHREYGRGCQAVRRSLAGLFAFLRRRRARAREQEAASAVLARSSSATSLDSKRGVRRPDDSAELVSRRC